MTKMLISFVTRPNHGSEGGVGWEFLKAALRHAEQHGENLDVVIDTRDETDVTEAAATLPGSSRLILHPVAMPRKFADHYGASRSRASYLAWLPSARKAIRTQAKQVDPDIIHQVTFATAVLPCAIPSGLAAKTIWGPVSVPWAATYREGKSPRHKESAYLKLARMIALRNAAKIDLVIATNDLTLEFLSRSAKEVQMEPNVIVSPPKFDASERDDKLLSMVGLLNDLKRPWLAFHALENPELRDYRLQVIGEGPLKDSLAQHARAAGISERIKFLGRLSHSETLRRLAKSRLLVHPSVREGASWVVGEAAAVGVPAVVFEGVGAASTVRMSDNGGIVCPATGNLVENLAQGILSAVDSPQPSPTSRWSASRLPNLLDRWWTTQENIFSPGAADNR